MRVNERMIPAIRLMADLLSGKYDCSRGEDRSTAGGIVIERLSWLLADDAS